MNAHTTMINNSSNINSKQKQPPLTSSHLPHNRPRHMAFEIQVLASDRNKYAAWINRLIGSQHLTDILKSSKLDCKMDGILRHACYDAFVAIY